MDPFNTELLRINTLHQNEVYRLQRDIDREQFSFQAQQQIQQYKHATLNEQVIKLEKELRNLDQKALEMQKKRDEQRTKYVQMMEYIKQNVTDSDDVAVLLDGLPSLDELEKQHKQQQARKQQQVKPPAAQSMPPPPPVPVAQKQAVFVPPRKQLAGNEQPQPQAQPAARAVQPVLPPRQQLDVSFTQLSEDPELGYADFDGPFMTQRTIASQFPQQDPPAAPRSVLPPPPVPPQRRAEQRPSEAACSRDSRISDARIPAAAEEPTYGPEISGGMGMDDEMAVLPTPPIAERRSHSSRKRQREVPAEGAQFDSRITSENTDGLDEFDLAARDATSTGDQRAAPQPPAAKRQRSGAVSPEAPKRMPPPKPLPVPGMPLSFSQFDLKTQEERERLMKEERQAAKQNSSFDDSQNSVTEVLDTSTDLFASDAIVDSGIQMTRFINSNPRSISLSRKESKPQQKGTGSPEKGAPAEKDKSRSKHKSSSSSSSSRDHSSSKKHSGDGASSASESSKSRSHRHQDGASSSSKHHKSSSKVSSKEHSDRRQQDHEDIEDSQEIKKSAPRPGHSNGASSGPIQDRGGAHGLATAVRTAPQYNMAGAAKQQADGTANHRNEAPADSDSRGVAYEKEVVIIDDLDTTDTDLENGMSHQFEESSPISRFQASESMGQGPSIANQQNQQIRVQRVVRNKEERAKMPGFECEQCAQFFRAAYGDGTNQDRLKAVGFCSRHRHDYAPQNSPDGFWELQAFIDETQKADDHIPATQIQHEFGT